MNFFDCFISFFIGCNLILHPILSLFLFAFNLIYLIHKKIKIDIKKKAFWLLLGLLIYFLNTTKSFYLNLGIVVESKNNFFIFQTLSGRYLVGMEDNFYQVGDILRIEGKLKNYAYNFYESQFDFNRYLANKLVYKEIEVKNIDSLFMPFIRLNSMIKKSLSPYDEVSQGVLSKLLFNLSLNTKYTSLIYDQGLSYYLVLSSFHLYFLLGVLEKLLRVKLKEKPTDSILLLISFTMVIFANFKTSIIRLALYKLIDYLNEYRFKNKIEGLEKTSLAFLILGIINPSSLFDSSFYYSFPLLLFLNSYASIISQNSKYRKFTFFLMINLFFLPFNVYQNGYFNLFSLLLGFLLVPYILLIYLVSLVSLMVPLNPLVTWLVKGLVNLISYFAYINLKFYLPDFNLLKFLLYYFIFFLFIYFFEMRRKKKRDMVFLSLGLYLSLLTLPVNNLYEQGVYFINVGQGDSILIKDKNKHYLIDTGGNLHNDLAVNTLIPFFRKHGVMSLDKVFITHFDFDHYGALESLQKHFRIDQVITQENYEPVIYQDFKMVNLNNYTDLFENKNDSSLVMYLNFKNYDFLFMGDASVNVERRIIKDYPSLHVDILKAGHHGSNTSTCEEFIAQYKPKEAILSCGKKNKYHHPHQETLKTLEKYQVKIRITSVEGTIHYRI